MPGSSVLGNGNLGLDDDLLGQIKQVGKLSVDHGYLNSLGGDYNAQAKKQDDLISLNQQFDLIDFAPKQ
jgi:hypothetical protein